MPHRDERVKATTKAGKWPTAGRMNVIYRDAKGYSSAAVVVGPGSVSGLKIHVGSRVGTNALNPIDNVPAATSMKQANVYFSRDRV